MIFEQTAQKRCTEPINLVENYNEAIADKEHFWYLVYKDKTYTGIRPAKDYTFVCRPKGNRVELEKELSKQTSVELF